MNLKPIGDNVLIKELEPIQDEKVTSFGIIIPDTVKDDKKVDQGEVIAVGPGRTENGSTIPMQVKVGDKVIYKAWSAESVKIDGENHLIISEGDIRAIIE